MHAYAVDGLDREQRDLFDRHLNQPIEPGADSPRKAREQRLAQQQLMAAFGKARG